MSNSKERTVAAAFPALCVVVALVLLSSMPIYRGLESGFSAEYGLGAAMTMLREEIEANEAVAVFLGLSPSEPAVYVNADLQWEEESAPPFDLAAEVAAYIERYTPDFILPLDGDITSPYGIRVDPFYPGGMLLLDSAPTERHYGVDISAARSRDIVAAADGVVRLVGFDAGYGNYLILTHDDCETLYAHCSEIGVSAGQAVRAGEKIAIAGATGRATGVHLHFEVLVDGISVDPLAHFGYTGEDSPA